jgi:hypothetical protein
MLVTAIERFICADDESFAPFNESGGEKSGEHANEHLLDKRRVHGVSGSRRDATISPETPLLCAHDPQTEKQVRDCVNDYA